MVFCNFECVVVCVTEKGSHNPYFNRWFSAMVSLYGLNPIIGSHNPYFNRWFSAIHIRENSYISLK